MHFSIARAVLNATTLCNNRTLLAAQCMLKKIGFRNNSTSSGAADYLQMQKDYSEMLKACGADASQHVDIDTHAVFVNNQLDLGKVNVYGFDYDHTLATYTEALDRFIFDEARNWLVTQMKYPDELWDFEYQPDFAIRGLHFDIRRGFLMKVDAFHNIQIDTVHRGLSAVGLEEILAAYNGTYLPSDSLKQTIASGVSSVSLSGGDQKTVMLQLMDFFTLPEFYLLSCIIQFFDRKQLDYQPFYIYQDVSNSVSRVHKSGLLGQTIMSAPEKYIHKDPDLRRFLEQLIDNKKQLFVISNSSGAFIDRGLKFLLGDNWRELFNVIISRARKPDFFKFRSSQFRRIDESGMFKNWEGVKSFQKSDLYEGGNLTHLIDLTKWNAQSILYFGDHVYSDLADVANTQGWTTAAVIPELEHEIEVNNQPHVRAYTNKLRKLECLINVHQHAKSQEAVALLEQWQDERNQLRHLSKISFNKHFGSIFRSFHNPSYFSRRLSQYAVLYTSRVTNLLRYPLNHVFYPKRVALPHEPF